MACEGRYATAQEYADFFCIGTSLSATERSQIESVLDLSAGDIHAARQAVGACDCTVSAGVAMLLAKLNIILAGVFRNCPCAPNNLTDAQSQFYLTWATERLIAISSGRWELCEGETGSDFPAVGWAEHAGTEFSRAETILKAEERY